MEEPLTTLCDRETFARVWHRVMPNPTPACPIELVEDLATPQLEAPQPAEAIMPTTLAQPSSIERSRPRVESMPIPTHPPEDDHMATLTCHGAQLQALIDHALQDARRYQQLARAQKQGSKTLALLYNQRKKHGKKLSAAYFLLSGVRYWPQEHPVTPLRTPYATALRQCYYGAQRSEEVYTTAALETSDRPLKELYLTLAREMTYHGNLMRYLLEQML